MPECHLVGNAMSEWRMWCERRARSRFSWTETQSHWRLLTRALWKTPFLWKECSPPPLPSSILSPTRLWAGSHSAIYVACRFISICTVCSIQCMCTVLWNIWSPLLWIHTAYNRHSVALGQMDWEVLDYAVSLFKKKNLLLTNDVNKNSWQLFVE